MSTLLDAGKTRMPAMATKTLSTAYMSAYTPNHDAHSMASVAPPGAGKADVDVKQSAQALAYVAGYLEAKSYIDRKSVV